uniref:Protein FAM122A n=1 Tax=Graphocephala atropunctata TaxID=36148 RepID=A0A1B6MAC7_9HEMI
MSNPQVKMEVDNPAILKRSSSAPMINELSSTMTTSTSTATTSRESMTFNVFSLVAPRTRRFSASFSPHPHSPTLLSPRLTPRVSQLRQEECLDVAVGRETAHERELNNTMVMSQSWEDLTIVGTSPKCDGEDKNAKPRVGLCDPLHLHLPSLSPVCSSPSPTRMLSRQVFSPNMWKTNLSPSPTRKFTTRRSLSPIAMRPSSLGSVKRKFDLEDNEPPAKRLSMGLLMPQSRLDVTASPLPGSLSSVGTPESVSSGDSPGGFSYRNMDSPNTTGDHPTDHPMQDLTKSDADPS